MMDLSIVWQPNPGHLLLGWFLTLCGLLAGATLLWIVDCLGQYPKGSDEWHRRQT